ncbi:hypothetical protein ACQKOC_16870 [Enterobacter mori]|uniref:hypothetical protein n=1 Tax=Enterobacter mori TaxID=539813 RepID=UPI003D08B4AB
MPTRRLTGNTLSSFRSAGGLASNGYTKRSYSEHYTDSRPEAVRLGQTSAPGILAIIVTVSYG